MIQFQQHTVDLYMHPKPRTVTFSGWHEKHFLGLGNPQPQPSICHASWVASPQTAALNCSPPRAILSCSNRRFKWASDVPLLHALEAMVARRGFCGVFTWWLEKHHEHLKIAWESPIEKWRFRTWKLRGGIIFFSGYYAVSFRAYCICCRVCPKFFKPRLESRNMWNVSDQTSSGCTLVQHAPARCIQKTLKGWLFVGWSKIYLPTSKN